MGFVYAVYFCMWHSVAKVAELFWRRFDAFRSGGKMTFTEKSENFGYCI